MRPRSLLLLLLLPAVAASAFGSEPPVLPRLALVDSLPASRDIRPAQRRLEQAIARLETRLANHPGDHEASLLRGLLYFKSGRLAEALVELGELTRRAPTFHLAHLIRGDLLLASTRTLTDIGGGGFIAQNDLGREALFQLREEAEVRLRAHLEAMPADLYPRSLLQLGESVETALLVDKANHRLYIFERDPAGGPPRLIRDFYVSTGKLLGNKSVRGDLRTPEGVYFVTRHIPDNELPDKYGSGAFPLNYPNELDRRLGKTGYGIWLHGTETAYYSRPPLDSEGCVVLPNIDLDLLAGYIHPGVTPVIITERVEWLAAGEWQSLRDELVAALTAWRSDWESMEVGRYLDHYAADFRSGGLNLARWRARKRDVFAGKQWQSVGIENLSLFYYPASASAGRPLVVANFLQRYRSDTFSSDMPKRLYLARNDHGRWQLIHEGKGN